jgi:hypothetical protein
MPRPRKTVLSATRQGEPCLLLTARIPKSLRYQVRLYCTQHGSRMDHFVAEAIDEALRRRGWRLFRHVAAT